MKKIVFFGIFLVFFLHLNAQDGLFGEYFSGRDFNIKVMGRSDARIDFNWPVNRPPSKEMAPEEYSIRWKGLLLAPESGKYKFSAVVDDGLRVWVGGKRVIDAWGMNDDIGYEGEIVLEKGKQYEIRVEYFNGLLEGSVRLQWKTPSMQNEYFSLLDEKPKTISTEFFSQVLKSKPTSASPVPTPKPKPATKPNSTPKPTPSPSPQPSPPTATPSTLQPVVVDTLLRFIPKNIQFVRSKPIILPESLPELDNLVGMLKRHPELSLVIEGHTDQVGDAAKNMELSKQRALRVARYLMENGIPSNRLEALGYGSTRPVDTSGTPESLARNRRVEFRLKKG